VRLVLGLDGLQQRWGYGGTASGVDAPFSSQDGNWVGRVAGLVIPALDGRKAQSDAFFGIDGVLVGLPSESLKGRLQLTVFRGAGQKTADHRKAELRPVLPAGHFFLLH
jgi:hypothetical protein